jgi:two-component system sensor histidine kinase BaeS
MFRSLRNRLILSHIIPALIIIPLMGTMMVYVLETRLLLPMVYRNLAKETTLMAELTRTQSLFWINREAAQALVEGVSPFLSGQVSLLLNNGRVLASSQMAGSDTSAQFVEVPDLSQVQQGEVIQLKRGAIAEVFTPVYDLNGSQVGIIFMSTRLVTVSDEIYQLRYLLGAVLLVSVAAGIGLGSYLAITINRPIQQVSRSINALADGNWQAHVAEQGPDEMRLLAQEVNTLVDRLNSLEQGRQKLLANLVHELGRPLGAIRAAIQALEKGADKDPELAVDLLQGMDDETVRLQRLLDDLAGLHNLVLGRLDLRKTTIQLNHWLPGVLAPWEAAAYAKGLKWSAEMRSGLASVTIDPDRMAQALGNLLSNAVKFTSQGGNVSVTADIKNQELLFQIEDTGLGIHQDEQEKIFQPFYRGKQGHRIIQGMGLGLSIASEIITAHGGRIVVESTPGTGSRFTIKIPVET